MTIYKIRRMMLNRLVSEMRIHRNLCNRIHDRRSLQVISSTERWDYLENRLKLHDLIEKMKLDKKRGNIK